MLNITFADDYLRVIHIQTKDEDKVWLVVQSPDEKWHLAFFDNGHLSIIDEQAHILVDRGAGEVSIQYTFGGLMMLGDNFEIVGEHPDISCIPQCPGCIDHSELEEQF